MNLVGPVSKKTGRRQGEKHIVFVDLKKVGYKVFGHPW